MYKTRIFFLVYQLKMEGSIVIMHRAKTHSVLVSYTKLNILKGVILYAGLSYIQVNMVIEYYNRCMFHYLILTFLDVTSLTFHAFFIYFLCSSIFSCEKFSVALVTKCDFGNVAFILCLGWYVCY
jgi:hypothetical protein